MVSLQFETLKLMVNNVVHINKMKGGLLHCLCILYENTL